MVKKQIPYAITLALASLFPAVSYADATDLEDRIHQLEQTMQQLQQQRLEQDKQIEVLTKELAGTENQLSQTKISRTEEKGKSQGSPVYAAFKDGLVFDDGSGNWKLQLNGRVQADYKSFGPDEWKNDTFSIRRARFGGTFTFLKDFAVRVEGEYANDNTGVKATTALTYGYLDYTHWQGAKIRIGQFKPFFGLERPQSTNFTDFTELSLATNNGSIFNSTYDRGVMVFGDPLPWLNYNVYAVNGTGQNNDDLRDSKDYGGRIDANLAALAGLKNAIIHVGASASEGSIGFNTSAGNGITQGTESNGNNFFSVTNISGTAALPSRFTSDRSRFGLEVALTYGPVKFQTEYIKANFEGKRAVAGTPAFDNDIDVWYADLNWMVTGESYADSYKSGVFGRTRPKNNFDEKGGWGAIELGLRYSKFDASDFKSILTAPTATTAFTSEADSWTGGAKWILNPNARVLLNYIHTKFDTPVRINSKLSDDGDALVLRAQYDF
jgi:phosphate-selective porin OprO and OprP